jgi:hypothetical protein
MAMVETRKWLWKWRHVPSQTPRYFAFLGENMRKHMIFWGEDWGTPFFDEARSMTF